MSLDPVKDFPFSDLPEDVGRLIFQAAAKLDGETGRSCALVSKKINTWVEPILYDTIVIRNVSQLSRFCKTLQNSRSGSPRRRSLEFYASHVKSLCIIRNSIVPNFEDLFVVLKACPNVDRLLLWGYARLTNVETAPKDQVHAFMTSSGSFLSPSRLSISSTLFPQDQIHFAYPIFRHVTHLHLVGAAAHWGPTLDTVEWDTLGNLKGLTHLSIETSSFRSEIVGISQWAREIIAFCQPSLRVFVIWLSNMPSPHDGVAFDELKALQAGNVDVRAITALMGLVYLPEYLSGFSRLYEDVLRDCIGLPDPLHGKDFWGLAEEIIEARCRRRGSELGL